MANIKVDGIDYDTDSLSEEAKATVVSLQFVQSELQKANATIAILKTAESAYVNSLKQEVEKTEG